MFLKRIPLVVFILMPMLTMAQIQVSNEQSSNLFSIVDGNKPADILYDPSDDILIQKSADFLAGDIEMVTGHKSDVVTALSQVNRNPIIVGMVGKSSFINQLVEAGKLDVYEIEGEWERFIIETVENPFPGVDEALVVVGSDKRGAAYGVFTISKEIGVSPWHFWADVPAQQHDELFIGKDRFVSKTPSVKYRGIFLNDEAPALRGWAQETFGDFNSEFYEKVYELLLRNKANYLWPAMWRPSVFATDDPKNPRVADEYGIVISTTHHEPMMRYHEEWSRYDAGQWNYETNKENLQRFWKGGIQRMGDYESVITLGMRGDGDEAMSEDTAVELLKNIIRDQRQIIEGVTGEPAEETPQVWALYKEVQDYYDKGMRVADDIMVLFCDDNWGNVRILPKKEDLDHAGGYGMYYHFDFVGGPVSYRWLNVTQIERVWEQMNLSYEWGVKDLWIVNVGDLKPMELPISFFLDFAWDASMEAEDLPGYYAKWAAQQFGNEHAAEIADILALSTKYSARRTPEMLKPDTYSIENYREADRIVDEYDLLLERSTNIYEMLPENQKAAFYQLVHFPIEILDNLNNMYVAAGKNALYGNQSRASTNMYADKVREYFFRDEQLVNYYHNDLADGKWPHMMSQTKIGYTSWNNPPVDKMPEVTYIQPPENAGLGYVIEHGKSRSPSSQSGLFSQSSSTFDPVNDQSYYLEIFNRGAELLSYTITTKQDWINVSSKSSTVQYEEKVYVSIDWDKVPNQNTTGELIISGAGQEYTIEVPIHNEVSNVSGFVENNGVISIEAANYSEEHHSNNISWIVVPNMGRTASSVTIEPTTAPVQSPGENTPHLEYEFTVFEGGDLTLHTFLAPTLNYKKEDGLKFAVAINDEEPQIINIHEGDDVPDWEYPDWWNNSVTDRVRIKESVHQGIEPGVHTLKVWMVDPGVVFQKFVLDAGGLKNSYLGPPESIYIKSDGSTNR